MLFYPQRWIGRSGPKDSRYITGLQGCRTLLFVILVRVGVFVKYIVHITPLPTALVELKIHIRAAIESIPQDRLAKVWEKCEYRIAI